MSKDDLDNKHKSRYYSGKKPYLTHNYRTMMKKKTQEEYYSHELHQDPMSEMLKPYWAKPDVEGFGWEYQAPPDMPWEPPGGWPPDEIGGCLTLVCNPTMLDCEGGCSFIACICTSGGVGAGIVWDDTGGKAYIGGTTETGAFVCTQDATDVPDEYPTIGVLMSSGTGIYLVEVGVVGCAGCSCTNMTLTGADTVNPGATWTGTIGSDEGACQNATCTVTSNSGCSLTCVVSQDGTQVTVAVGATDCGSFTVEISCGDESDSKSVRINDTGQGGGWAAVPGAVCHGAGCGFHCAFTTFGDESTEFEGMFKCDYACSNVGAGCVCDGGFPCTGIGPYSGRTLHCSDLDCQTDGGCNPAFTTECDVVGYEWGCVC